MTLSHAELLIKYLDEALSRQDPASNDAVVKVISRIFGNQDTRELYDKLASSFNPLQGVHLNSYMPMKTGKHKDGTDWTPQEILEKRNKQINYENILGDAASILGTTLGAKDMATGRVFQNMANTRGQRERELYGANSTDWGAAAGAPMAQALGTVWQTIGNTVANRLYGDAALKRQAEMQAVMDAYNRNVGGTGLFYDARRKAGEDLIPKGVQ